MLIYPAIDPVAFHLGPLPVHWYGLMYLMGFIGGWGLLAMRIRRSPRGFTLEQLSDILFYVALGVILGGRLGYVLFYQFADTLEHPWHIFAIWQGGMSFHGGLIGVILAVGLYARKIGKSFVDITDLIAPVVPIGLGAGRIGNFINGELWGRVTDVPWGMVFPTGGDMPRHPSQLYEFFLEGVILFLVLWFFSKRERPHWAVSGLFLLLYGVFRFIVEFFREPDIQIGFVAFGWMSKGQLLSIPMIIAGIIMLLWAYRRKTVCSNT
ncbi:MAG TPA: prolipoprotein diacylglyceryl transferase [Gammaproteobacteria bacterium]|nr:prolipoprotein diacylglyceryl transferase [Gammaproteobacteria bacterium]